MSVAKGRRQFVIVDRPGHWLADRRTGGKHLSARCL